MLDRRSEEPCFGPGDTTGRFLAKGRMQSCELSRHVEVPQGFKPLDLPNSVRTLPAHSVWRQFSTAFMFGALVHVRRCMASGVSGAVSLHVCLSNGVCVPAKKQTQFTLLRAFSYPFQYSHRHAQIQPIHGAKTNTYYGGSGFFRW